MSLLILVTFLGRFIDKKYVNFKLCITNHIAVENTHSFQHQIKQCQKRRQMLFLSELLSHDIPGVTENAMGIPDRPFRSDSYGN